MYWNLLKTSQPQTTKQMSWFIVNTPKGVGVASYTAGFGFDGPVFIDNSQHHGIEITHWMYLPDAP